MVNAQCEEELQDVNGFFIAVGVFTYYARPRKDLSIWFYNKIVSLNCFRVRSVDQGHREGRLKVRVDFSGFIIC